VASPVSVPRGRTPTASEALVRNSEVAQLERLAHEPDLEVVRVHANRG
jgi:hypothetical protein